MKLIAVTKIPVILTMTKPVLLNEIKDSKVPSEEVFYKYMRMTDQMLSTAVGIINVFETVIGRQISEDGLLLQQSIVDIPKAFTITEDSLCTVMNNIQAENNPEIHGYELTTQDKMFNRTLNDFVFSGVEDLSKYARIAENLSHYSYVSHKTVIPKFVIFIEKAH